MQSELLALRRAHLEIAHQLETSNEEIRALSLRLQENVSSAFDLLTNHFSTDINNTKKKKTHQSDSSAAIPLMSLYKID